MKLTKSQNKRQNELLELINSDKVLTQDERWMIYEEFNPSCISNITAGSAFFTPVDLAQDLAVFSPRYNSIIDVCGGIGVLSYRMLDMDYYHGKIKSLTIIEMNPEYLRIAKRLLSGMKDREGNFYDIRYIQGNVFDKELWDSLPDQIQNKERGSLKFDVMISNPPYGAVTKTCNVDWMNYKGDADLMAMELCLRYAEHGYFIVPPNSVPWQYSGRPYYQERESRKYLAWKKANQKLIDFSPGFNLCCDGIDTSIYKDAWKGTSIITEAVNMWFE